jgi:hypothetical protein
MRALVVYESMYGVVGAPTHMHGLSSVVTRRMAARAAARDGGGLRLEPNADGPGLPEWLKDLGRRDGLAAAFETRINSLAVITGRASRPIARLLKRHGFRLVAAPQSFLSAGRAHCLTARPPGPAGGA